MDEYLRRINLLKIAVGELQRQNKKIHKLRTRLSSNLSTSDESEISSSLQYILETSYVLIKRTKTALDYLKQHCFTIEDEPKKEIEYETSNEETHLLAEDVEVGRENPAIETYSAYGSCYANSSAIEPNGRLPRFLAVCGRFFPISKKSEELTKEDIGTQRNGPGVRAAWNSDLEKNQTFLVDSKSTGNLTQLRIRQNLYAATAYTFREALLEFQIAQNQYKHTVQEKCLQQIKQVYPDANMTDIGELMRGGSPSPGVQEALRTTLTKDYTRFARSCQSLQHTYEDVRKLEQCVLNVHAMFIELNALLDNQHDHLSSVATTLAKSKNEIEQAYSEIASAHDNKIATRKSGCLIGLCILALSSAFFSKGFGYLY